MVVPIRYREAPEIQASFTFSEIASGTGFVQFYMATARGDLANILTEKVIYSDDVLTEGSPNDTGGVLAKFEDFDFDVKVNKTLTMKGNAYVNVPFGMLYLSGSGTLQAQLKVYIRHWDGTTETDLGNAEGDILVKTTTSSVWKASMDLLTITVTEKTFKPGDTIRVTVELWASRNASSGKSYYLAHDPKNRDDARTTNPTDVPTEAFALLPFKILNT